MLPPGLLWPATAAAGEPGSFVNLSDTAAAQAGNLVKFLYCAI